MSHVTTIDATDKYDIPSLKQMCKNEGWEFIENKTTFAWFGRHVGDYPLPAGFTVDDMGKCSHAIRIPGCTYEVGVVRKGEEWKLLYDFWGTGGLKQRLGENAGLLKQSYSMAKTQTTCKKYHRSWKEQPVKNRKGWKKIVVNMAKY